MQLEICIADNPWLRTVGDADAVDENILLVVKNGRFDDEPTIEVSVVCGAVSGQDLTELGQSAHFHQLSDTTLKLHPDLY